MEGMGDVRSSELKTWPFWRTRARGSAMVFFSFGRGFCVCVCVFLISVVMLGGVGWLVGVAMGCVRL